MQLTRNARKVLLASACALVATLHATPTLANSAAVDYFRNRADRTAVPSLLSLEERAYYRDLFAAILEAMTALRRESEPGPDTPPDSYLLREQRREAYMRKIIRAVEKQGFERIAIVCGAWHGPAVIEDVLPRADEVLLRGLPRAKVLSTWIPWTYSRLSLRGGYGAGIASPGWYHHLFSTTDDVAPRWLAGVARMLRDDVADIGIATESLVEHDDLITLPCYDWQHVMVVPAEHALAAVQRPTLEQIAEQPLVLYRPTVAGRSRIDAAFARAHLAPQLALEAIDSDVIKTYVRLGLGVGIVTELAMRDEAPDSGLVARPLGHLFGSNVARVAFKRGAYLRHFVLAFTELLSPRLTRALVERAMSGQGSDYEL